MNPVFQNPDALRDFAIRYTAAWCSHRPDTLASFFEPEGSLRVNDDAPAVGPAAIAAIAQGFYTAFPDLQVLMDGVSGDHNGATYHWTLLGANTGPGGSGRKVRISGYEQWRFGPDNLIAESQGHFDAADYQRQLQGDD